MATVFVVGATGRQGGAVARALLAAGHQVRGLTRSGGDRANELQAAGIDPVVGDLTHQETLTDGMQGCDVVFGLTTPFGGGPEVEVKQGTTLIAAAQEAEVGHFVFSSVASADKDTAIHHFESKRKVELLLADSSLSWTITRPVYFMENLLTPATLQALQEGVFPRHLPGGVSLQQVNMTDYGAVVADIIGRREAFVGKAVDVASDELTGEEQARILSRLLDREIIYEALPASEFGPDLADLRRMYEWFEQVGYSVDLSALHRSFPDVSFHDFASWAAEALRTLAPGGRHG